jgi:hypothetical protein
MESKVTISNEPPEGFDPAKAVALPTICTEHWAMLREKVDAAGLGRYVAQGGENAMLMAAMLTDQLQNGLSVGNWDPLMGAWYAITGNAMEMAGPQLLGEPGEPGKCVICFLNTARNPDGSCPCGQPGCGGRFPGSIPNFETWLDKAVLAQVEYAKREGLALAHEAGEAGTDV